MTETEGARSKDIVGPRSKRDEQIELFPENALRDLLEVERDRLESQNRRTEVQRLAVQASDDADKRQYDFHMRRLELQDGQFGKRHTLTQQIVLGLGLFSMGVGAFIFYMAFFGSADQRAMAIEILRITGLVLAGIGIGEAARQGLGKLFKTPKN